MTAALCLASLFTLGAASASDFSHLLIWRAFLGFTLAGLPAVAMAYLSEEIETSSLVRAMGLYISGNALGGMSGRFLAALITDHYGWRTSLVVLGILSAGTTLMFWRLLPPSRHFKPTQVAIGQLWRNTRQ